MIDSTQTTAPAGPHQLKVNRRHPRHRALSTTLAVLLACAASVGAASVGAASVGVVPSAQAVAAESSDTAIAHASEVITRSYTNGSFDWSQESALATLVSDALLNTLSDRGDQSADFSVINPGAIRADIAAGDITRAEALAVLPFTNDLWTQQLTGAQIIEMLEQQWQTAGHADPTIALGLSSNLTYTYDPAAEEGHHVRSVSLNGTPIDTQAVYRVGSIEFLLEGGDGFSVFAQPVDRVDTGLDHQTTWLQYLSDPSRQPITAPTVRHATAVSATDDAPTAAPDYDPDSYLHVNIDGRSVETRWYLPTVDGAAVSAEDVWLTRFGDSEPVTDVVHLTDDTWRHTFDDLEPGSYTAHLTAYSGALGAVVTTDALATDFIVPDTVPLLDPPAYAMTATIPAITAACLDGASTRTVTWQLLRSGDAPDGSTGEGTSSITVDSGSQVIGLDETTLSFSLSADRLGDDYMVRLEVPGDDVYGTDLATYDGTTISQSLRTQPTDAACTPQASPSDTSSSTQSDTVDDSVPAADQSATTETAAQQLAATGASWPLGAFGLWLLILGVVLVLTRSATVTLTRLRGTGSHVRADEAEGTLLRASGSSIHR